MKNDAKLLSEVRTFEPVALRSVPQMKKNLQHVSIIKILCTIIIGLIESD